MQAKIEKFLQQINDALATEQLILPSLPDVALQIRTACEQEDAPLAHIAEVLSQDPALSVRLLQLANSSLYRTRQTAENIHMAIARLGLKRVKDLITGLAMKQIYQASTDVLQERFRELWLASVKTAAIARMLATDHDHLDAEQAMLAGLTHNIGALPILMLAEDDDELFENADALHYVIHHAQGIVGASIFRAWHFADYMIDVTQQCYDFDRRHQGPADYVDIVQAALVEGSIYTGLECPDDWSSIAAFDKLAIDTGAHVLEIEENKLMFEETQLLFK